MIDYFSKARELGAALLETEEFAQLRAMKDLMDQNSEIDGEKYKQSKAAFEDLVNQVIDILRMTVFGDCECGGCASRCCRAANGGH